MTTPVVELHSVSKSFDGSPAVRSVSFSVAPSEVFTLLGPSGCGKSTSLRLIAGLESPDSGRIDLSGERIADGEKQFSLPANKRQLGMVFQSYAIWPHMTVAQNVSLPLRVRKRPRTEIKRRVTEVLDLVGLAGFANRSATQLSGGQQQRVALARALVYEPSLLLLDEPLSNLDASLRGQMRTELRRIQRELGIALVFVTHDQDEAMMLSDRIAVMNAGGIEQVGEPRDIYETPATPFVRDFLGRALLLDAEIISTTAGTFAEIVGENCRLAVATNNRPSLQSGARVLVSCRLESVRTVRYQSSFGGVLRATVTEVAYQGDQIEYQVLTAGERLLSVLGDRREPFSVGDGVAVEVDPGDMTLWPQ